MRVAPGVEGCGNGKRRHRTSIAPTRQVRWSTDICGLGLLLEDPLIDRCSGGFSDHSPLQVLGHPQLFWPAAATDDLLLVLASARPGESALLSTRQGPYCQSSPAITILR